MEISMYMYYRRVGLSTGWPNKIVPVMLVGTRFSVKISLTKPVPMDLIVGTF
jgi:hypothetical protein